MHWGTLWMLMPDEALPLVIAGVGLALMLGLVSGRAALGIVLGLVVLPPLLAPLVEAVMGGLPPWVSLVILAFFGLAIIRGLAALLIGSRAADTMVGSLAADLVRFVVAILLLPLRVVGWALRMASNGNGLRRGGRGI